ncbi:MAG: hypothetical protein HWE22_15850 [Flavobacteriales bacterium]|nr:hypothetical protein [Flavobacteriales bacterium]
MKTPNKEPNDNDEHEVDGGVNGFGSIFFKSFKKVEPSDGGKNEKGSED